MNDMNRICANETTGKGNGEGMNVREYIILSFARFNNFYAKYLEDFNSWRVLWKTVHTKYI